MGDTGDTMVRDLLRRPLLLMLMLMLGMVIMDMVTDMDTTDHTDTGDTMVRHLLRRPQLLDPMLMLMLMLGMDTMTQMGWILWIPLLWIWIWILGKEVNQSVLSENTITFF